ncbi:23S rRNA (uracil(1939)-C(5))-methyltransferase RlmD [Weissella diestrammenae]|uniref:23S rRNA (Uracil(1939)-C(5))-methyltransferase RlmD n=1 Tax=Weissella diestrammenae TaxID=1162633 RepID=A0A7G9T7J5_9LACO|nr:23S rRNA (uracil(1939)-C(5))-methyltransferase RlmD [Weissella diestrammenae]MCM0582551.1 23S rRNA (uracil(1939)-C(5))-methyltransferase RlmD [Weissella diestrammenae]QNN76070.1 23S rRNA (uracil(1939)-C(5))-methyltransferase RlmD [Weissella diestrammenae]
MPRNILPVKLNEIREGLVSDVLHNGMGVILVDNTYPVKLVDAFLGETIQYQVTQVDRLSAFGQVLQVLKPDSQRIDAQKAYLLTAGVAPYVNLSYDGQLNLKQWQVQKAFAAHSVKVDVAKTIGTDQPTHYRNKTVVPLKYQAGQLVTGFFDRRDKVTLVPMVDYYVNQVQIDAAVGLVRDVLAQFNTPVYDDGTHQGAMRYIMIRRGYYSHELMVVLVSHESELPNEDEIAKEIAQRVPEVTSVILNHNPRSTNQQLTGDNRTLWGQAEIHDTLLGRDFVIGPNSFYQVNPKTTEVLYQLAADVAELKPTDTVIDAYSGIGTIGLTVADKVATVLGVEVVARAVADAQINIANNHITNAQYVTADAPEQMQRWKTEGLKPDVIFVDPPRRGLTTELMDAVVDMQPDRFVYISCNPVTMARDSAYLLAHGYQIKGSVRPLDQFPQTAHIEAVALFIPNDDTSV